jgi:hypothetical protein
MPGKKMQLALLALLLLYAALVVVHLARNPDVFQWDFRTCYFAAKAHALGLNPYDIQNLGEISPVEISIPYHYQPLVLYLFYPFLLMRYSVACQAFLFINIIIIIYLFYSWRYYFINYSNIVTYCLFIMIAFNNTIYRSLAAGNISLFEQFIVWTALVFLVHRRRFLFCLSIVLAAIFKFQLILFLGLLFLSEGKKPALIQFGLSSLGFAVIVGVPCLSAPNLFPHFLTAAQDAAVGEIGDINPSTLAIIIDFLNRFSKLINFPRPSIIAKGIYLSVVTSILIISRRALIALKSLDDVEKKKLSLLFACMVYSLIVPLFKDYTFILLLPPAFLIIFKTEFLEAKYLPFIIILFLPHLTLPLVGGVARNLMIYYPLLVAYFVCYLYVRYIFLVSSRNPDTCSLT